MDAVLGLSVTATDVRTVLVEGTDGDGATLEHGQLDVFTEGTTAARASEQVAEAVLSMASTAEGGHRLRSIGVTWREDADLEASLVLESLAGLGFDNVVAVQLPRAAEALGSSIGQVIGYQRTAVCVLEADLVVLSTVDQFGAASTAVSHAVRTDEQLLAWIESVFDRADVRPDGLFLVGSVDGLDELAGWLSQALDLPVFDPPEAELALAHGAALVSAHDATHAERTASGPSLRAMAPALSLIGVGAVSFVVAAALAVGPQLIPGHDAVSTARHQVADAAAPPQAPPARVPTAPAPQAVEPPAAPAADEPPAAPAPEPPAAPAPEPPAAPAPEPPAAPAPEVVVEAPPPAAPIEEAPPELAPPSIEAVAPPAPVQSAPINPIAPPPAVAPAPVLQVPAPKPRLRDRILDKIPGLNRFG